MKPATYNFPARVRGDTFPAWVFTLTDGAESPSPLAVTAARLQVRTTGGKVVQEWDNAADPATITITGAGSNVVTLSSVAPAVTELWAVGVHTYDLEVTMDGKVRTILAGTFQIDADITR